MGTDIGAVAAGHIGQRQVDGAGESAAALAGTPLPSPLACVLIAPPMEVIVL